MTVKLSTGLRNAIAQGRGFSGSLNKGYIKIFSGSQPATADAAETGTNLGIVTVSSGALTKETRATGTLTVTGTVTQTILTITVGGVNIIPDDASMIGLATTTLTADLIAYAINRNGMYEASTTGASNVVTIRARPGAGVIALVIASTGTCTCTGSTMTGGVAGVNGLMLGAPVGGSIPKLATQIWSFVGINGPATAGWFRFYSSDTADSGATCDGTTVPYYPRLDGSIATSGSDLNLSQIVIQTGAPNTIDSFSFQIPSA